MPARMRELAGVFGQAGDQRTGALLAGGGGEDKNRDVLVLLDQLQHFLRLLALADHRSGITPVTARALRVAVQHRIGFLMRFRAHDVGDAQPLLVAILGLDDAQHDHAGAVRSARRLAK